MFYVVRFIIVWIIWFVYADKRRWKEILPVCVFASFLGVIADTLIEYYPRWEYVEESMHPLFLELGDEFEIFPVVTYLFIQWVPANQTLRNMFLYFFGWTGLAILIEYIHLVTDHMEYLNGWSIWHSYIADWILFWLFYKFHKVLGLRKLSR
ncbi:CBO0543 family protein [Sporomusa acidovorans]|uniref:Uncharacterized protein n=1 Tax=Sporomusa acidovorans (strain ATCC 49682 / DSM 3132 / Mol) TaxID=1123286 RepID=A0ABZ3JAW0_SPOA4|nr:CBO0543 family protein [Sporomusa acidovorans]OZC13265.1 hypothetical protein SPACI_57600 [Sporomusa acidovorans DSM 3132]SDD98763.1 hypothetical protein SAMN04488499_100690 [Sporomusa acidovorans]